MHSCVHQFDVTAGQSGPNFNYFIYNFNYFIYSQLLNFPPISTSMIVLSFFTSLLATSDHNS